MRTKSFTETMPFLSLFWKGFLFLSVVVLSIAVSFAVLNYFYLEYQFQDHRRLDKERLSRQIGDLLTRSSNRLEKIGSVLAAIGNFSEALHQRNPKILRSASNVYSEFQYDLDIEAIDVFTPDGQAFWQWKRVSGSETPTTAEQAIIRQVSGQEAPATRLLCNPQCTLNTYMPILANGQLAGIFSLSQSVAQLVVEFRLLTGADIGILIPGDANTGANNLLLQNWNFRIAALTNAASLTPFMQHLAQRNASPARMSEDDVQTWNDRHYFIHIIPLDKLIEGSGYVLMLTDVTEQISHIRRATLGGAWLAAINLTIAEFLLLLLMRFPLRQLRNLTDTLPLLAHGAHREARKRLTRQYREFQIKDEIYLLHNTALTLSHRLEEQAEALEVKARELAAERDFVRDLLDAAQVIIITQTDRGTILTVNEMALQVTGYAQEELCAKGFTSLIAQAKPGEEIDASLAELWTGKRERLQHEAELLCRNGAQRHVVWVHTRLKEQSPDGIAVLSVGLDVTDRIEAERQMMWLAHHDPLTSLYNRHRFHEELVRLYGELERNEVRAALLIFDLDHFKEINDTSGHPAGDTLLRMIATELRNRIRKSDIAGRLGGDEFAVLMPNQTAEGALAFANLLNLRLAEQPLRVQQKLYRISASIGIAMIPEHGYDIDEIMANADLAMYYAKNNGRGRAHIFSYDDKSKQRISERTLWKQTIQNALECRRLTFHYQPIRSTVNGKIEYYEALLRIKRDDGSLALPGEFLEFAHLTGLIKDIDRFVIEEMIKSLDLFADNPSPSTIHINLSAAALADPSWTEPLKAAVAAKRLRPEHLIFEITETAAVADFGMAKAIMEELAALGFRFAIDDFGVGFASFSYVRHLPVTFIKIDQSYVTQMIGNPRDQAFVTAINTLAHGNDMQVIAEGVEDAETLRLLSEIGVDFVQGYHIGRPGPMTK
jgi:diguanylate cyclase (GGDEF)-like protein/PAS domain S-box-containing protein